MPSNQRFRKSSNNPDDPNFNLDEYLEKKGQGELEYEEYENESPKRRNLKNGVLLAIILVAFVTWVNNFTNNSDWASFLGFNETETVTTEPIIIEIPPINIDIPEINIRISILI